MTIRHVSMAVLRKHNASIKKCHVSAKGNFTTAQEKNVWKRTTQLYENAVKFADYVFENYSDVDSKFPPTLWAQPPDVSGAMPHTNNGDESYHSHLNAEFYVKHPNIYMFVDVLKKVQQTAYVAMNSLSQPARISKDERDKRQFAVAAYYDYRTHVLTRQQYRLP